MTATRLALRWVSFYTRGLTADARAGRLAEIESDLWEQRHDQGDGVATEVAITLRWLSGVCADLSWRRAQRRHGGRRLTAGSVARGGGWSLGAVSLVFLLSVQAYAATALVGLELYGGDWPEGELAAYAGLNASAMTVLLAGAATVRRLPRIGATLLVAGGIGSAILPLCPALALLYGPPGVSVGAAGIVLARRLRQRASSATS